MYDNAEVQLADWLREFRLDQPAPASFVYKDLLHIEQCMCECVSPMTERVHLYRMSTMATNAGILLRNHITLMRG